MDHYQNNNILRVIIVTILILLTVAACSRNKFKANLSMEQRMERAIKMFNDRDYLDAKTEFRIIILNFQGSTLSDKAQFYYAECHFNLKEYILAISEYEKLTRVFSNSEYVDDAQYKVALSYYKLSPKYALDQINTEKAIQEFQKFLEDYPYSTLVPEADKYMQKCREKLAKKHFRNGESYRKRTLYRSALVYYDHVLDNYYDTSFAEKSLWAKAECLKLLGQHEQAEKFYKLYLEKYPDSSRVSKIKNMLSDLRSNQSRD